MAYLPEIVLAAMVLAILWALTRTSTVHRAAAKFRSMGGPVGDPDRFACRVELTEHRDGDVRRPVFVVRMRGRIRVPRNHFDSDVQVLMADVTEGASEVRPVLCSVEQWQMEDSPAFCFTAHNGRIPRKVSVLANWVQVAEIPVDCLIFPRAGSRRIRFVVSLLARRSDREIVSNATTVPYENAEPGYIDNRENFERTETGAIYLAAEAARLDNGLPDEAVEEIRGWIEHRLQMHEGPSKRELARRMMQQSLERIVAGPPTDERELETLCRGLCSHTSIMDRYQLVRFCLQVVAATGQAARRQTDRLSWISERLDVNPDKFRAIAQKVLPIHACQIDDLDFLLGLKHQMDPEQVRLRLNQEYQKWNARVTHPDAAIRAQADRMLSLIAEARAHQTHQPC